MNLELDIKINKDTLSEILNNFTNWMSNTLSSINNEKNDNIKIYSINNYYKYCLYIILKHNNNYELLSKESILIFLYVNIFKIYDFYNIYQLNIFIYYYFIFIEMIRYDVFPREGIHIVVYGREFNTITFFFSRFLECKNEANVCNFLKYQENNDEFINNDEINDDEVMIDERSSKRQKICD